MDVDTSRETIRDLFTNYETKETHLLDIGTKIIKVIITRVTEYLTKDMASVVWSKLLFKYHGTVYEE